MAKAKREGALYLDSTPVRRKSLKSRFSSALAMISTVLVIGVSLGMGSLAAVGQSNQPVVANAGFDICGTIGLNMDGRAGWGSAGSVPLQSLEGRYFMLSEVAAGSLAWKIYEGTGDGGEFLVGAYDDRVEEINADRSSNSSRLPSREALPDELKDARSFGSCVWTAVPVLLGNLGLSFAGFVTNIVSWIATSAFNPWFICDPDTAVAASQTNCIDLVSVIGGRTNDASQGGTGEGSSSGVIGALTTGLYKPLIVLVVIMTALLVAWTGIVKRRFREAFGQAIWLVVSFLIGLALILNPSMLVRGPMYVGNAVLGCIVGAFNGNTTCSSDPPDATDNSAMPAAKAACVTGAKTANAAQTTTFYISSMTCSIWSAFILEPYARGAYGVGINGLDMESQIDGGTSTVGALLESEGWNGRSSLESNLTTKDNYAAGIKDRYCVRLGSSTESYESMQAAGTFTGDNGPKICNLAVWDILMSTNYVTDYSGQGITSASNNPDPMWFEMLSRLPQSDSLWAAYSNQLYGGWFKFFMGAVAVFASIAGGTIIAITAMAALVYYVLAIVMIAFAPVFFLIGMHPGRGKKLMLGWVEQIVSNLLKYVVSAVFVLIAVSLYGAVLGTSTSLEASFLFVILIGAALAMYRTQLINMLGRVGMGGEQMVNAADRFLEKGASAGQRIDRAGKGIAAGAIAGLGTRGVKGIGSGVATATMRELRSGQGLTARTLQAASTLSADNKEDARSRTRKIMESAKIEETNANQIKSSLLDKVDEAKPAAERLNNKKDELEDSVKETEAIEKETQNDREARRDQNAFNDVVHTMYLKGEFAQNHSDLAKGTSMLIKNERDADRLIAQQLLAEQDGDFEKANDLQQHIVRIQAKIETIKDSFTDEQLNSARHAYAKTEDSVLRNLPDDPAVAAAYQRGHELNNDEFRSAEAENASARFAAATQRTNELENEFKALEDEWNAGFGAQIQGLTDRYSAAKNAAATKTAQANERNDAIDKYTAGDIRTTGSIRRDMKEAEARGVAKNFDVEFDSRLTKALGEIQDLTGTQLKAGARSDYHENEEERLGHRVEAADRKLTKEAIAADAKATSKEVGRFHLRSDLTKLRQEISEKYTEFATGDLREASESLYEHMKLTQKLKADSEAEIQNARAAIQTASTDVEREALRKTLADVTKDYQEIKDLADRTRAQHAEVERLYQAELAHREDVQKVRDERVNRDVEAVKVPRIESRPALDESKLSNAMIEKLDRAIEKHGRIADNDYKNPKVTAQLRAFTEGVQKLGRHTTDEDIERLIRLMDTGPRSKGIPTKRPGS